MLQPSLLSLLIHSLLISLVSTASPVGRNRQRRDSGTVWATPHDAFSSSIGVLGCKVNTNRVAYWPQSVDCTNICIALTYQDRTVHLLRIDQSEGAYDVSYDAWNYLYTGYSATDKPAAGGPIEMTYKDVDASNCKDLIDTKHGHLPLSAANSMNFLTSCLEQNNTWVGENYVLYNILDSLCTLGRDETCDLDYPNANQAACPHQLGLPDKLENLPVYNIRYPSGEKVSASDGQSAPTDDEEDVGTSLSQPSGKTLALVIVLTTCLAFGV
ncbi:uncharacterized protein NECHADRAFT_69811 [Fusarium vanettenii 77-13-4]|uniref:Cerato-platanin n=1 Tax=Fusarium vanettenii (strain ATCC MYA-4622 / CBS 123669 / FGSC 9596 / NRRL 45880 / 77-13-4) TaxID=660122 RepID=C7ZGM7_FUSV7|nr:uncharacterized protein NECHADRAFT_69811 [Fusarium vanettenii 77-13-4]EEU36852.1 hypothetical protein NECHADRAFT_69811 [Fusarium vanettenii 77-13-4]